MKKTWRSSALAFVLILYVANDLQSRQWMLYAFSWRLMFVLDVVGQAIRTRYSLRADVKRRMPPLTY